MNDSTKHVIIPGAHQVNITTGSSEVMSCSLHSKSSTTTATTSTATTATSSSHSRTIPKRIRENMPSSPKQRRQAQQCRSNWDLSLSLSDELHASISRPDGAKSRTISTSTQSSRITPNTSRRNHRSEASTTTRSLSAAFSSSPEMSRAKIWDPTNKRGGASASRSTNRGRSASRTSCSTRTPAKLSSTSIKLPSSSSSSSLTRSKSATGSRSTPRIRLADSSSRSRAKSNQRSGSRRVETKNNVEIHNTSNSPTNSSRKSRRRSMSSYSAVEALISAYDSLDVDLTEEALEAAPASDSDKALRGGHMDPLPGDDETIQASGNGSQSTTMQSHEQCSSKSAMNNIGFTQKAIREAEIHDNIELLTDEIMAMEAKLSGLQQSRRALIGELATTSRQNLKEKGIPEKISFDSSRSQRKNTTGRSRSKNHQNHRTGDSSTRSSRPTKETISSWKKKESSRVPITLSMCDDEDIGPVPNQVNSRVA